MLIFTEFALLRRPLLLLFRRHYAPNLPADLLADHFQLLLLRLVAQRRVLLRRLDLLLGVIAYRLDLGLLFIRQVQRRVIFRRFRAHRSCRTTTARMCRRGTTALLRHRRLHSSATQSQTAEQRSSPDPSHEAPFGIRSNRVTACSNPISPSPFSHPCQPTDPAIYIDVPAIPLPKDAKQAKNRQKRLPAERE